MAATVKVEVVAKALNLTPRRIMQLAKEGMPRAERGQYDPWACALWYIRYLQKALEARGTQNDDGSATSWREERKRLIRLQANNEELEYRKRLGELMPVDEVRSKFVTFAGTVHDRFIALPSRLSPRLEGESREVIRVKLFEAIRDTLNGLSQEPTGRASGRDRTGNNRREPAKRNRAGSGAVRGRA